MYMRGVVSVAGAVIAVTSTIIGAVVSAAAVVDSSFLEQDEKDNVKIIKIRKGIFIFLLYHFR